MRSKGCTPRSVATEAMVRPTSSGWALVSSIEMRSYAPGRGRSTSDRARSRQTGSAYTLARASAGNRHDLVEAGDLREVIGAQQAHLEHDLTAADLRPDVAPDGARPLQHLHGRSRLTEESGEQATPT